MIYPHNATGYGPITGFTNTVTPSSTSLFPPRTAMVSAGNGEAVIRWTAPPVGSGGSGPITGYIIQRWNATDPNNPVYVDYKTVLADQVGLLWEGLTNGVKYTFQVYTQSAGGNTPLPTSSGTAQPDGGILSWLLRPTSQQATDQQDRQSTVTWAPPALAVPASLGILATHYTVRAFKNCDLNSTPAATAEADQPTAGQPTATVTGLKNGTSYCFTIQATNLFLLSGQSGPTGTITPAGPPFAPVSVAATRGDKAATVSWLAPPQQADGTPGNNGAAITGYSVESTDLETGAVVAGPMDVSSPQLMDGLTNGHRYTFTVKAANVTGTGAASAASVAVTPAGAPFPPEEVRGTSSAPGQAEVTWLPPSARPDGTLGDNGSPITNYKITWPGGSKLIGPMTSATVDGLSNGTGYIFGVQAINGAGISSTSSSPGPATPKGKPSKPLNVTATPRDGYAVVQWSASEANGAPVTYAVSSNPGVRGTSTQSRMAIFDGLTNGQAYTFTVQASNSVGSSEVSDSSLPVTPVSTTPPQPSNSCVNSINYEEQSLPSGAHQAAFQAPCLADLGKVRLGFFIAEEETVALGYTYGDGDGRTYDQNMQPGNNRVYVEVDFSTGLGSVFSNRSCTDKTETRCTDALTIGQHFSSGVRRDGGIDIHFEIANSRTADIPAVNWLRISADLAILPKEPTASSPQNICVTGQVSQYPSVEGYYDNNGATYTMFQLGQSPFSGAGLGLPDRDVPAC